MGASARGQDASATPSATPEITITGTVAATPAVAASAAPSATPTAAPSPSATPTPSLLKTKGVKLEFLPPPMEGTISLGIYDSDGKLVRVLHREAGGDEFFAALDGYITHWDGLDDAGNACPAGHYSARGYLVGEVTVEKVDKAPVTGQWGTSFVRSSGTVDSGSTAEPLESGLYLQTLDGKPFTPQAHIHASLVSNPLDRDRGGSAQLAVGTDDSGSWLELADGLPLKRISSTPNLKWTLMGRAGPTLLVFQSQTAPELQKIPLAPNASGTADAPMVVFPGPAPVIECYKITKVANMMAFDCGEFELPGK